ncbi:5-(carboxyamino)imidazole ribonucleotide synthase [Thalassotalea ponticola]|uniref:5-(carboxyamino)imidazole ribonucleotide synthase n=1 Tax=Thalassotalea ponticola TaxID=1523392 RepID=UPI0025B42FD8|nr:5-(carboxyamino)imidazole ribonucleotide synthase [Thalassotalea ponticola]MDN3653044.1 5-(carboxyamino)imidazole ribonucleotide synthase [Thalassotalea ponticola]
MKNVLVLGAGQLARMMDLAGTPLNLNIKAFDVRTDQVVHPLANEHSYGDLQTGIDACDVITAEFEHISHDVLAKCEASGKLLPSSEAIKIGGDRRLEKALLESCKVANAKHVIIESRDDFDNALNTLALPIIFKSALEGYDGKGQWRLKDIAQADAIWQDMQQFVEQANTSVKQGIVAEQMVPFDREISIVGARSRTGEIAVYPITENHHTNGVLSVSIAVNVDPSLQQQALEVFTKLTEKLDYVGVLAIEFFQVGQQLLVNEIAPRVHNSGHWTQQGTDCCQFENHLRAIVGLPLGNTELIRPTAMVNILGEDSVPEQVLAIPGVAMHWYNKQKRAGRKMGHINICAASERQLAEKLQQIAGLLDQQAYPDLQQFADKLEHRLA